MGVIAREFLGGFVVKASVFVLNRKGEEVEKVKIISPRAYHSRSAAEEFKELAARQGARKAFVTDKADDAA